MDLTAIIYILAETTVGFITVIGNCLVLAVIIRTHQLHTVTNVFVGNLAIADIAVGVLVAPCAALSFLGLPHNFYACVFINCLILTFTNVSILMLLAVAIERFIAIKEPFVYQRLLTVRRAIYVNFFVWSLGFILGLVPMYGWHRGYRILEYCSFTDIISYEYLVYFQFFGLVLLPLLVMLCIYIYILLIVRRHMRQTNALHNQFRQNKDGKDGKDGFNRDVKAAKMFALVIFLFGVFWFPVNLFNCVSLFCGNACKFEIQGLLTAIVMSHANSSLNPFLYATSNSRIKRGLKELLRIKLRPEDRNVTDYDNKRHTTNGMSYVRDNSVAPISSVGDTSNNMHDGVRALALSQKAHPGKNKISVLPSNQYQQNGNGSLPNTVIESISDTDIDQSVNEDKNLPEHRPHTSNSWLSALAQDNTLPDDQRPPSQNLHHENQQILKSSTDSLQSTNTSSKIPLTSQPSYNQIHHDHNNQSSNKDRNSPGVEDKTENNFHRTISDNDETIDNHSISSYKNGISGRSMSESTPRKKDNIVCWTTSATSDTLNGGVHDMKATNLLFQKVLNGKQHSISKKEFQKTNMSGELSEELIVQKLKGYVSSERA